MSLTDFFKTRQAKKRIARELQSYNIQNYIIHSDLSIDVMGNVIISGRSLKEIPFQFGMVSGDFNCGSNQLISLKGSPTEVGGNFVAENNKIISLKYAPRKVGKSFFMQNNKLEPEKIIPFVPEHVAGDVYLQGQYISFDIEKALIDAKKAFFDMSLIYQLESKGMRIQGEDLKRIVKVQSLHDKLDTGLVKKAETSLKKKKI